MKAIVCHRYGPPDVLNYQDIPTPSPGDDEVLVKIYASSINSWDWNLLTGTPFLYRMEGCFKPRHKIPGADIAGKVDAVGKNVTRFKPGDEVFGDLSVCGWGGYAEYVSAPEEALALKSAKMSFEQAAASPQAGILALQGLRDVRSVEPGQKVLINGAGGGAGTFAVQMAKSLGADVTAVDSEVKLDTLRSLGADHVIDYAREDFARNGEAYDLVVDMLASRSFSNYRRALRPGGGLAVIGSTPARAIAVGVMGPLMSKITGKKMKLVLYRLDEKNLNDITALFEDGKAAPVIDRCYPLSDIAEAFRYFEKGQFRGKIVITM